MSPLQRTPLYETHLRLGGRMVEFAGFEMPVQYSSILDEHAAVRERAGLFDVSHMGQIHLRGPGAIATAERLATCAVASLREGRVRYGMLCNERGGVVDDVTVYREGPDAVFFCVNAANVDKDRCWIEEHAAGADVAVDDRSGATALLALQGPTAPEVLAEVADPHLTESRRFAFATGSVAGHEALVSNTGYTGSPGYEIYLASDAAVTVFDALLDAGADCGILPVGLGARDTLRLEAALPLYGHELDDETSPLEAGLGRFVKREAGGFLGAEAIEERAARGHERALAGFELTGRGVARAGYAVRSDGAAVGRVTSGAPSPTLGRSIGLAWVPPSLAAPGSSFEIEVRGREIPARVVEMPFVAPLKKGRTQ